MALTAKQAIAHIKHTLYRADSDIEPIQVVNTAGKILYQMRTWNFRQGGPATLSFVASQAYVDLPSNFGQLVDVQYTDARLTRVYELTPAELQHYRLLSEGTPRDIYVAVTWVTPSGGTRIAPRLEVYPTPSSNTTDALTFMYRTRWVEVTDDDADLPGVPELAEPLYLRICRQLARSYEDEDVEAYTDTLNSLMLSMEYRMAAKEDIESQGSYGSLQKGVGYTDAVRGRSFFWDRPLGSPS